MAAAPLARKQKPNPADAVEVIEDDEETALDLERLFAIRDNELSSLAANNLLPPGYDSTEHSPLPNR